MLLTSAVVAIALLVVGFVAVSFVRASADAKFDEVGRAVETDSPSGAGPSGPSNGYDEPIERDDLIEGASNLNPMRIGPSQFPAWPFTIESGILSCEPLPESEQISGNQVLANITLRADDGTVYALNGTARGRMEARGWHEVQDIWESGDIGPIIDLGHAIC